MSSGRRPGLSVNETDPSLVIELRIETSRALLSAYDAGDLDAAIVLRVDRRRGDGEVPMEESFGWMGVPDFRHAPGEPLRLAAQSAPCTVRSAAIEALDRAGIPWTEAFVGGGVATIGAAISAGLAVGALVRRVAPAGTIDLGPRLGLPTLQDAETMLHSNPTDAGARGALRTLGAAFRAGAS